MKREALKHKLMTYAALKGISDTYPLTANQIERLNNAEDEILGIFSSLLEQEEQLRTELSRKNAQIKEALAILENGSNYEKLHVSAILRSAL